MEIKTELLQKMVAKVVKGASNNKMLPITSLLGVETQGNELILTATDGNNTFKAKSKLETNTEDFYTIVNADTFAKLIGKTTKEYVVLTNNDNYLEIVGNGTYRLEIAVNEEGQLIHFADIPNYPEQTTLKLADLQNAILFAKAATAKTLNIPMLTGYYIANDIITTDQQMVCKLDTQLVDTPMLMAPETAELILLIDDASEITLARQGDNFSVSTSNYLIYGKELDGKDIYPVKPIENLLAIQYENMAKIDKQAILNVLDRMSLFVSEYDKGGIHLVFNPNMLQITSQKSNAVENIELKEGSNANDGHYLVNIDMLKAQLSVLTTDLVEIHYGTAKSLKFVEGNASLVIALQDN